MGHSGAIGLSDCYRWWLMAPFQPCLLSAGLSSKMDVVFSVFLIFDQSLTLLPRQSLRPTRNASQCRWNSLRSNVPLTEASSWDICKETLKKRLLPALSRWLLFPPPVCAHFWSHILFRHFLPSFSLVALWSCVLPCAWDLDVDIRSLGLWNHPQMTFFFFSFCSLKKRWCVCCVM